MIIPVQVFNYFKAYVVSNKVNKKSGVMGDNIAIRLLDVSAVEDFYNGNNPIHTSEFLLDHYTNGWLHISSRDMIEILESRMGLSYPTSINRIIVKSINHGDMIMTGPIIPINKDINHLNMIDLIFKRSIALLGYYIEDEYLDWIVLKEINIGGYEDWCYLLDHDITGLDSIGW